MGQNGKNNGDNDKNGKGGKMIPYEEFLRRRFPGGKKDDPAPAGPQPVAPEDLPTSPQAVLAAARLELAAYFNFMADPRNPGIRILKGNPHYQILEAVWNDDMGKIFSTMMLANIPDLTRRWYWHFPDNMQDVSFLTPAHLARTLPTALLISRKNGDFTSPDSEGRTPLYYIARHGRDSWLIPYIVSTLGVDPYQAGRASNDHNAHTPLGTPYEEPFLRAVRHANTQMVKGFLQCAPAHIDLGRARDKWGQTPLMIAVQEAHSALITRNEPKMKLARRLWIIRALVTEHHIDVNLKDIAGNKAADYALHPQVQEAFNAGLAERQRIGNQPQILRKPPPPGPQPT